MSLLCAPVIVTNQLYSAYPGWWWSHCAWGLSGQGLVSWSPTTVKWQQFSQSSRHSIIGTWQTKYHEALPSSVNVQSHLTSTLAPGVLDVHLQCKSWPSYTGDFKIDTHVATFPDTWGHGVGCRIVWPGVSILWLIETASLMYSLLSQWGITCNWLGKFILRDSFVCWWDVIQSTCQLTDILQCLPTLCVGDFEIVCHSSLSSLVGLVGESSAVLHIHQGDSLLLFLYHAEFSGNCRRLRVQISTESCHWPESLSLYGCPARHLIFLCQC